MMKENLSEKIQEGEILSDDESLPTTPNDKEIRKRIREVNRGEKL